MKTGIISSKSSLNHDTGDEHPENKYRIQSEIYKDIQALRDIGFSEKEIKDMMKGRRAVSKDDIRSIMLGLYNPENVPEFRKDSGVRKAVEQINRELETDYKISDFINKDELRAIKAKYKNIPLGLSESERIEYLRTTTEKKLEDWISKRASSGRMAPRGFPRDNKFN